jgi:ABC-type Fe3+ transport system substrate-binding protein
VTIPKNTEHRELAEAWVAFLLSPEGREILRRDGQAPLEPPRVDHLEKVPGKLKVFFK